MCDNGYFKYFFWFIRLITIFLNFIIHFKKSQNYKREQTKTVRRDVVKGTKSS